MPSNLTEADRRRLKLMGISKAARHPMFNGRRKDVSAGNFTKHCCALCGKWAPCEMEKCTHAVCTRVMKCCDSTSQRVGKAKDREREADAR